MSYQHCPVCRITVPVAADAAVAAGAAAGGPCPRCGSPLADEPRPLFAGPPIRSHRFGRPASALSPEAVRTTMATRRGRSSASDRP